VPHHGVQAVRAVGWLVQTFALFRDQVDQLVSPESLSNENYTMHEFLSHPFFKVRRPKQCIAVSKMRKFRRKLEWKLFLFEM